MPSSTNTLIHSIQALTFDNLGKNKYDDDNSGSNSEYDSVSEYSISEGSDSCDESDSRSHVNKKVPSWAKDTEYIKKRIQKQIITNEHTKVFGKFKVEKLNLSMIFCGNQDDYTNRNSTADWKGDTSFVANSSNMLSDNYDNYNKQTIDKSANRVLNFDNE